MPFAIVNSVISLQLLPNVLYCFNNTSVPTPTRVGVSPSLTNVGISNSTVDPLDVLNANCTNPVVLLGGLSSPFLN